MAFAADQAKGCPQSLPALHLKPRPLLVSTNLDPYLLHVFALLPAANFVDTVISSSANLAAIVLGLALGPVHLPEGSTEEAKATTSSMPQSLNSQHSARWATTLYYSLKRRFSESHLALKSSAAIGYTLDWEEAH